MESLQILVERFQVGVVCSDFVGIIELLCRKFAAPRRKIRLLGFQRFFAFFQLAFACRKPIFRRGNFVFSLAQRRFALVEANLSFVQFRFALRKGVFARFEIGRLVFYVFFLCRKFVFPFCEFVFFLFESRAQFLKRTLRFFEIRFFFFETPLFFVEIVLFFFQRVLAFFQFFRAFRRF